MEVLFRHSNYKATLRQPTTNQNVIDNIIERDVLLPSNHPILKYFTSKAIIRPSLAADDSNFYEADNEELTVFDGDDEELIFDEEDDELTVFNEENITSDEDENPARSTILDEESTAPDPILTVQDDNPTDDMNMATTSTFYWQNPYKVSSSNFQQCSYWTKGR